MTNAEGEKQLVIWIFGQCFVKIAFRRGQAVTEAVSIYPNYSKNRLLNTEVRPCLDAQTLTVEGRSNSCRRASSSGGMTNLLGSEAGRVRCVHEDLPLHREPRRKVVSNCLNADRPLSLVLEGQSRQRKTLAQTLQISVTHRGKIELLM